MFKKIVSFALTAAQVGQFLVIVPAFSAESAPQATPTGTTPEFKLVKRALALEGQNLSPDQLQSGVVTLFKQYTATASTAGAEQRLANAFVQLGIYTPEQSDALVSQFDSASQRLLGQQFTSEQAANRAMTQEVSLILATNPSGAQFSGCGVATVTTLVLAIGGGLALLGAGVDGLQALNNSGNYSNSGLDTPTGTAELAIGGAAGIGVAVGLYYILSSMHAC